MEALYYDPRIQKKAEVIELLNDWGFRLVEVASSIYIVEDFFRPGEDGQQYIEIIGQDVTKWIYDQTQTMGLTKQAEISIKQKLSTLPIRRRKFSSNIAWYEYLSTQAHNV